MASHVEVIVITTAMMWFEKNALCQVRFIRWSLWEIIFLKDIFYVHFMSRFILESTRVTAGPDSVASTTQFLCFEFVLPKALIFVLLKKYRSTFIRIYDDIIYMCSFCRVQDFFGKCAMSSERLTWHTLLPSKRFGTSFVRPERPGHNGRHLT